MKVIFIDANIYLRFFDSNQRIFKKLLDELLKIENDIFITNQIVNEVNRNKLSVFEKSITNYKNKAVIEKVMIPEHFVMETNTIDIIKWNIKRKEIEEKNDILCNELETFFDENLRNISYSKDFVSLKLNSIFKNKMIETEEELLKSKCRKEIGNPPGKQNDSLGDQISWEQLLNKIKIADETWIISNDFDYFTKHNKRLYLNSFLINEVLSENPKLKINCFNTLSDGLKSYFKTNPVNDNIGTKELDEISEEEHRLNRTPVISSNILSIGYDANSATLEVEFINNSIYHYFDVPQHIYSDFMAADSIGKYLAQNIKGVYNYEKV